MGTLSPLSTAVSGYKDYDESHETQRFSNGGIEKRTMTTQVFQFPALPRAEWRLPVGVDQISFTHNHFMPNLLSKRHEKWSHMQIVSHRLWFDPGNGFPESSDSTMDASFAEGMIIGEIDAAYTQDGIPITEHDLGGLRNLVIDKLIAQIDSKDAVGRYIPLNEIIVDPQGNVTFNPERKFSKDTVRPVWETIDRFLTLEPNGTVFPDLRNEEFAPFLAELSYKDEHVREHVAVNFYTFSATLASDLVTQVEAFNPHPDWKTRFIGGVLNFYPNELISLAQRLQMPAETVEDMVKVGQRVLRSYPEAGIELFALVATSSGLTSADYPNFPELPASVQQTLLTEEAIVKLVNWARNDDAFPHLKIGSGTRSYDFSIPVAPGSQQREDYTFNLITCLPAPWPKDPILRRIRQLYSTPGRAEEVYNPDFLTTDEPQGASFSCCGIPADDSHGYRHPRFDMIPAGQE